MGKDIKTRENRVRRQLARQGYRLHKSRTDGCVYSNGVFQGINVNDCGGYMAINTNTNAVAGGWRYDWSLRVID